MSYSGNVILMQYSYRFQLRFYLSAFTLHVYEIINYCHVSIMILLGNKETYVNGDVKKCMTVTRSNICALSYMLTLIF